MTTTQNLVTAAMMLTSLIILLALIHFDPANLRDAK